MNGIAPGPALSVRPPSKRPPVPSSKKAIAVTLLWVAGMLGLSLASPWLLSAVLIVGCGVYVAFEFALVKVSLRSLERDESSGLAGASVLLSMKREMNSLLAACQFGITLTSLGLTLALEPAIHEALIEHERLARYSAALAMSVGAFIHVTF